jgi:hypothetical protein
VSALSRLSVASCTKSQGLGFYAARWRLPNQARRRRCCPSISLIRSSWSSSSARRIVISSSAWRIRACAAASSVDASAGCARVSDPGRPGHGSSTHTRTTRRFRAARRPRPPATLATQIKRSAAELRPVGLGGTTVPSGQPKGRTS